MINYGSQIVQAVRKYIIDPITELILFKSLNMQIFCILCIYCRFQLILTVLCFICAGFAQFLHHNPLE